MSFVGETPTSDSRLLSVTENDGFQELVCFVLLVLCIDGLDNVVRLLTLTLDQTVNSDLYPLPPFVSVHGIVTTNNGGNLAILLLGNKVEKLLHVYHCRPRSGVATVAEEVDIDMWDANFLGGLKESVEVGDVRVNTAIGDLLYM